MHKDYFQLNKIFYIKNSLHNELALCYFLKTAHQASKQKHSIDLNIGNFSISR
ncbi:MAG: hypothetical protein ACI88H_000861 [Cocleimonas sp.]|jgi:hypothetical protein